MKNKTFIPSKAKIKRTSKFVPKIKDSSIPIQSPFTRQVGTVAPKTQPRRKALVLKKK